MACELACSVKWTYGTQKLLFPPGKQYGNVSSHSIEDTHTPKLPRAAEGWADMPLPSHEVGEDSMHGVSHKQSWELEVRSPRTQRSHSRSFHWSRWVSTEQGNVSLGFCSCDKTPEIKKPQKEKDDLDSWFRGFHPCSLNSIGFGCCDETGYHAKEHTLEQTCLSYGERQKGTDRDREERETEAKRLSSPFQDTLSMTKWLFPNRFHFLKSLLLSNNPLSFELINRLIRGRSGSPHVPVPSQGHTTDCHLQHMRDISDAEQQSLTVRRFDDAETPPWVDFNPSSGSTLSPDTCVLRVGRWVVPCPLHLTEERTETLRVSFKCSASGNCTAAVVRPLSSSLSPRATACTLKVHLLLPRSLLLQLKLLSAAGNAVVRDGRFTVPETVVKFFLTFPKPNCVNETARQEETHGWRSLLVFVSTQNISIYVQNIILQYVTNSRVLSKND